MLADIKRILIFAEQKHRKLKVMKAIETGSRIEFKGMVMVVTGENETRYTGYNEYKGKNVGECSIEKSMFSNPHYMNQLQII